MPISVTCAECGQRLKAKDSLAGRTLPCPKCGAKITIPSAEDDAIYRLLTEDAPAPQKLPAAKAVAPKPLVKAARSQPQVEEPEDRPTAPKKPAKPTAMPLKPIRMNEPPVWLRHLHWLLVLALIPLAFSLLQERDPDEDFLGKFARTLGKSSPDVRAQAEHTVQNVLEGKGSIEDLFAILPDRRVEGAFLARNSGYHWLFAVLSALLFLIFLVLLASYQTEGAFRVVWIALFTATAGIAFLLIVQTLANWSQYIQVRGVSFVAIFLWIVKFIGFSYQAANDPENGFLLSRLHARSRLLRRSL